MKKRKSKRKAREWFVMVNAANVLIQYSTFARAVEAAEWLNLYGEPRLAPFEVIKVREVLK